MITEEAWITAAIFNAGISDVYPNCESISQHNCVMADPDEKLTGDEVGFYYSLPPGYYFWDESASSCYGPYPTRDKAVRELEEYALQLNTRSPDGGGL